MSNLYSNYNHFLSALKRNFLFLFSLLFATALFAQPVISSFSPNSGPVGTTVTINGHNFRAKVTDNTVYFGAVKASITSATDTTLTVTVPTGATYMPITVTVNALTAYASKPFSVTFPGTATGFKASSFSVKKSFETGGNPRSIAVADFDGDGKSDLFITNQSSATASVFRNTSTYKNISLAPKQDLPMEADPFGIATGDFDGDGKTDIAISNANSGNAGSVSIRRNTSTNGSITFTENLTIPVGNGPHGVSIADLNADGKPDLIVTAGNSGVIAVFKNNSDSVGRISFAPQMNITSFFHADHITLADLDGDSKPEIITADFSGNSMSVWRNMSSGGTISFAARISYTAGTNPVAVSAGDFDNDGKTDIAVANYGSNTVSVFRNNSLIGFISLANKQDHTTGAEPRSIALGDIDGDGKTDIIVPCNTPSTVSVLRNTTTSGNHSFANRVEYTTGNQPPSVSIADIDGDSKPEIIVPNDYNSIAILRNRIDEPIIYSFTPTAAKKDSIVTIRGENFIGTSAVSFGGTPASSFTIIDETTIKVKVDTGSNGVVQVSTVYGIDTLGLFTYIPPPPVIKTISPTSGTVGTEVRIVGEHFDATTAIKFGSMQASSFTVNADTVISAIVGKGATGDVIVSGLYGSDTLSGFTFIPPVPAITSFTPTAGTAGTQVVINGNNFKWITGVSFGNIDAASYIVKNDSTITTILGKGGSGVLRVTNEYGTDTLGTFIFLQPNTLLLYPNPIVGSAMLAHPVTLNNSQLKLVDMNGRVMKIIAVPANEAQTRLDVTNVKAGIYKVIWTDGQTSLTYTILVQ
jgi:hypothetical protein